MEHLEPRRLLSVVPANINISRTAGNQAEGTIAVDRADPSHLFAVSNVDVGDGLLAATSSDGGATWAHRLIADDHDGLPPACCDPSATFDSFGNLFLAYLDSKADNVVVLLSTDGGQQFTRLQEFHGDVDQPTITTGSGGVWLTYDRGNAVAVTGAADLALGSVGAFEPVQTVPGSSGGSFGDIAVGATGQVYVTYQKKAGGNSSKILVNVDPDGLGPAAFGKPVAATTTHVGDFDYIPAQSTRGIDAEAGLAVDRSSGPFAGRVYLVYTDQLPATSGNTDVLVRYSDDGGALWSDPIRVNDDQTLNSQFLPRVALDDTTGDVAVGWYDARNDAGNNGGSETNQKPNDDVQYFAALLTPAADGLVVSANQQISGGSTDAFDANNSIDLGDYTGLDFYNGTIHPEWFDNSNSTGDNPDGTLKDLDVYSANVAAGTFAAGPTALSGLPASASPVASLPVTGGANPGFVKHGRSYTITVQYSDPDGLQAADIGGTMLSVTGPNGFAADATLVRARARKGGTVVATYRLVNPTGIWTAADAGTYTISLAPAMVVDGRGRPSPGGTLGTFAVATAGTGSHSGSGGSRHHRRREDHD